MKKIILMLAICFGFFVCQDVVAQSVTKVNATPQTISSVGGSNTANSLTVLPNSSSVVTKQAQQVQLQAANPGGGNNGSAAALQVTDSALKNGQQSQATMKTIVPLQTPSLGRAVIELP